MTDVAQLLAGLAGLGDPTDAPRLVGIGWATVDIERTVAGLPGVDVRAAADDELLGARAWRTSSGPVALVLLEPNTEGRLAAALARRGEGIAALYLVTAEPHRRRVPADGARPSGSSAAPRPALGTVHHRGQSRSGEPQRSWWVIDARSCRPPALSGRVRSVGSAG